MVNVERHGNQVTFKSVRSDAQRRRGLLACVCAAALVGVAAIGTRGATITQTASDTSGTSSYKNGTNFPGGAAPTAGNAYVTPAGLTIRTNDGGPGNVFGGDSLEVEGQFADKSASGGTPNTVNLLLGGGNYFANVNGGGSQTLAGTITLLPGTTSSFTSNSGGQYLTTFLSRITGTGSLTVAVTGAAGSNSKSTFSGTGSDYSGGTTLTSGLLDVTTSGGLGTGNVTVNAGGAVTSLLQLDNAGAIGSNATVSLAAGTTAALNYATTDTVKGLTLGGTVEPAGVYTAANSGGFLTGTGTITVAPVPEPASLGLLGLGGLSLLARRRRA